MGRIARLVLFLLLLPAVAHAQCFVTAVCVSEITGGTQLTGGSITNATVTATIRRPPGFTGSATVTFSLTGPLTSTSPLTQTIPSGSDTASIVVWGSLVGQSTAASVKALDPYSPDPGQTTNFTVAAMPLTLTLNPNQLTTPTNETGVGKLKTGEPLRVGSSFGYNGSLLTLTGSTPFLAGGQDASFTFKPANVSVRTTGTSTVTLGPVSGAATVTLLPGGPTNLGGSCDGCGTGGRPINFTNGNVWITQQDYSLPGLGGGLSLERTWNSLWTTTNAGSQGPGSFGMFGHSWRSTYEERITPLAGTGSDKKYWRADGSAWIFAWDSVNLAYVLISPFDARASLAFDTGTNQFTLTFLDGSKRVFDLKSDGKGYLRQITDRNGNTVTVNLDTSKRITSVTDAAGRSLTFTYAGAGTLAQTAADSVGTVATYNYDGSWRLTKVTYADGSFLTFTYDAGGNSLIASVKDTNGVVLESHTYDANRRGLTSASANGVEAITITYPTSAPTTATVTDSLSNLTTYTYGFVGGRGYVTNINGPGCSTCGGRNNQSFSYDGSGNRTSSTDALGRTTNYTYDTNGNVLSRSIVVNGQTLTWTYTYNSFGQVLTAADPLGHTTTNAYDVKGNLTSTITPSPDGVGAGSTTSFAYDVKGQLISVTDPRSNATSIFYTAAGLIDHITDAQSHTTSFAYDARGNRTSVTDALSQQTTFTYNNMNRLTRVTNPDTTHTDFAYDNRGRRTSVTDANAKVTSYAYDDADRLLTVTDAQTPTPGVTQYTYDTENNLLSITDALGRVTSFTYDSLGRVTQTTFPSTLVETYTYDAVGNLLSKTDRKGQTISYSYDELDRLTHKGYPDSTGVDYTYDAASRLTNVSDPTGTYQFSFDNVGRLTGTTTDYSFLTSRTFTNSYSYDTASNRTSFTDPESGVTSYVYDSLNRLTTLTPPAAISSGSFGFTYDALGRRTQLTRPNGVNSNYSYDNLSRLLSVLHQVGATTIDGATYTVDAVGNRTVKTNQLNAVTENYGYDAIYQLLQVTQGASTSEAYSYDAVGNRLSTVSDSGWTYNNSNQLSSRPGVSYTYDNNGNTLTKTEGSNVTTYAWDYENRLAQVTLPGGAVVTFKYDPFGRRVQKSSASGTVNYAYDGAVIAEEVDASGSALARYTMGPGIDEPLAMLRSGVTSYYQADGLGSVTSLTDGSGSLAASYTYDSFGKLVASSGTLANSFRYTGREFDGETGLYYYRARYYDVAVGRFTNEDPIGLDGGINVYTYAENRPVELNDPMGLCATRKPCAVDVPLDSELRKVIDTMMGETTRTTLIGTRQYGDNQFGRFAGRKAVGRPTGNVITQDILNLEAYLIASTIINRANAKGTSWATEVTRKNQYMGYSKTGVHLKEAMASDDASDLCIQLQRVLDALQKAYKGPEPGLRDFRAVVQGRPPFVRQLNGAKRVAGTDFIY